MNAPKDNRDRILSTVKYIEQNLDTEMSLEMLAAIACLSPCHFQRVFKSIVGESPKQLIKRLRLEAAAHIIVLSPQKSILEVALMVGFGSLEAFSRAFKDYYSVSPDTFRNFNEVEKLNITRIPNLQRITLKEPSVFLDKYESSADESAYNIQVVSRPSVKFYYIRTTLKSAQKISDNFSKARKWATAQYDVSSEAQLFGIIKDYPFFTSLDNCRYLVCVALSSKADVPKLHNYDELPAGIYASLTVKGGIHELIKATQYLAHQWIPDSGYKISPDHALQIPLNNPAATPFDENEWQVFIKLQKI